MPIQTLAIFFLAAAAMGGVAWVFIHPVLSGERKAEKRVANVAKADPTARVTGNRPTSCREAIENTLKEFEGRHKPSRRVPLSVRIAQAGLS
jgi:tight adherence protein B